MTFTELGLVLFLAVAALAFINFRTSARLGKLNADAKMMFAIIVDVVDKKASLYRGKDGKISVNQLTPQEKSNGTSN